MDAYLFKLTEARLWITLLGSDGSYFYRPSLLRQLDSLHHFSLHDILMRYTAFCVTSTPNTTGFLMMILSNPPTPFSQNKIIVLDSKRNWASADSWSSHKEIIRRLYIDQNRKLEEVISLMEEGFQFFAT